MQFGLNLDPERTPFFTDLNVRKALLYALDRQAIVDVHFQGFAAVADTVLLPNMWATDEAGLTGPIYSYDPEMAATLLDDAGWLVGAGGVQQKDGVRFSIVFSGNEYFSAMMSIAQEQWREIGVETEVELVTWEVSKERRFTNDFDVEIVYMNCRGSGFQGLSEMHTDAIGTRGNYGRYSNPRVDELIEAIRTELDQEARIPYFTELQNIYFEDLPFLPIAHDFDVKAVNTRVHNLYPNPYQLTYNANQWWVEP